MPNRLLMQLSGKTPQACIDHLYAAIYVVSKQVIQTGFPVADMVNKLNDIHSELIKGLKE